MSEYRLTDLANPGPRADEGQARELRGRVAKLLKRNGNAFPGAQPVSFAREHVQKLHKEDYYVCEKSDGIRYLLYLSSHQEPDGRTVEAPFLIDRKNNYYFMGGSSLHFPIKGEDPSRYHVQTLIDGELVMDEYDDGRREPKFLVFDCLVLDGRSLMDRTLDKRLGYFQDAVLGPYKKLLKDYPQEVKYQPFMLELKAMQFSYSIEYLFREVLPNLRHGNDGLIFTCRNSEYHHGTDPNILKWKPIEENTVDFRWKFEWAMVEPDDQDKAEGIAQAYPAYDMPPICHLYIFLGSNPQGERPFPNIPRSKAYGLYASLHLEPSEWETLKSLGDPLDCRVVECYLDAEGRWRFLRFRDDKDEANHITTAESVMASIRDGVTKAQLLEAAKTIKDAWKARAQST